MVSLIALTAVLLTRYKTTRPDECSIVFPLPLHILLISTELAVIVIRFAVVDSTVSSRVEAMREAYNHLPGITRLFKVGTLIFYMTTMLLQRA